MSIDEMQDYFLQKIKKCGDINFRIIGMGQEKRILSVASPCLAIGELQVILSVNEIIFSCKSTHEHFCPESSGSAQSMMDDAINTVVDIVQEKVVFVEESTTAGIRISSGTVPISAINEVNVAYQRLLEKEFGPVVRRYWSWNGKFSG